MKMRLRKALLIRGFPNIAAVEGEPYAGWTPIVSGGLGPYNFSGSSLPAGLTCDATTGRVTGMPTGGSAGVYTCRVYAFDRNAKDAYIEWTLTVTAIVTTPGPIIANQTLRFGALTRANAGRKHVLNTGTPITNADGLDGITGGSLAAEGWIMSAAGALYKPSHGVNAGTLDIRVSNEFGNDIATITIAPDADEYSVASTLELTAAMLAIGTASAGARTVRCRSDGVYSSDTLSCKNRSYLNRVTITHDVGEPLGPVLWNMEINNADKITLDGLDFFNDSIQQGTSAYGIVYITNSSNDIIIQNCDFHCTPYDLTSNYYLTTAWGGVGLPTHSPYRRTGVYCSSSPGTNLTVDDNYFHDCWMSGAFIAKGIINIRGNKIVGCYYDSMKVIYTSTTTEINIEDNFMYATIPAVGDHYINDPHTDGAQIFGAEPTPSDCIGVKIYRNIYLCTLFSGPQPVWLSDNDPNYFVNPEIKGNLLITNCATSIIGIRAQMTNGATVIGNTVARPDVAIGVEGGITLGEVRSLGVHVTKNNACHHIGVTGPGTHVPTNNSPALGAAERAANFVGPTFVPTTRDECISMFTMKPGAPLLDVAVKRGAAGSGYVNWPATNPGHGGSFNSGFE